MTRVFQRQIKVDMPLAVGGEGLYIVDSEGKRYLDASGGAAVSCLGHGDADVIAAIKGQLDALAFAHTAFFSSHPAEKLADRLITLAPEGIEMVYFLSGGSEAVEASLKMARQYFLEIGEHRRTRFIARRQSYHGNTIGALSVSGNMMRREPYKGMLMNCGLISPCYPYRGQRDDELETEYGQRVADELENEILRLGPENVAAFIAETVGGATAGVLPPVEGYFMRIREICDKYGVLLILDEVMSGMGRTGTLFACEQEGIVPDLICIAKGLGAGYQPIGATLVSARVFAAFRDGSGMFQHGHTYMGHPTACAAALAVQNKIAALDLLTNVRRQGEVLVDKLHERFGKHPNIGNIRGRGLFQGIELVADRATKDPLDPKLKIHARIKTQAMQNGLICYSGGGTADGEKGDHVLLAPPFIIEAPEIADLVDRLGNAIDAALEGAGVCRSGGA